MYAGRIVESAPTEQLFKDPRHAYTRALQHSIPALQKKGEPLYTIPGTPPDLSKPIPGCSFAPRCETDTRDQCLSDRQPELKEVSEGHWVRDCPGCLGPLTFGQTTSA